jgi:hypothetical protein
VADCFVWAFCFAGAAAITQVRNNFVSHDLLLGNDGIITNIVVVV